MAWYGQGWGGYSHVDFLLPGGGCVGARSDRLGGLPPGFELRSDGYEKWKRRLVLSLPCTQEESEEAVHWLVDKLNEPYDKRDILGLLLGKDLSSGSGWWICSSAQLALAQHLNKLPAFSISPQQFSPNMLLVALEAIGAMKE